MGINAIEERWKENSGWRISGSNGVDPESHDLFGNSARDREGCGESGRIPEKEKRTWQITVERREK